MNIDFFEGCHNPDGSPKLGGAREISCQLSHFFLSAQDHEKTKAIWERIYTEFDVAGWKFPPRKEVGKCLHFG